MLLGVMLKRTRSHLTDWLCYAVSEAGGSTGNGGKSLGRISRTADGRFVVVDSSLSNLTTSSSSDDGGFLSRQGRRRASWRRPLVAYPSQLSLRSDGSGESVLRSRRLVPTIYAPPPPRIRASSPANPTSLLAAAWSPAYNFSDLSSVRYPSSIERSFPSTFTPPSYLQLRTVHERYSQELPSLRAIHEEGLHWRPEPLFLPVHPLATSSPPRIRIPPHQLPPTAARPRARLPPRHVRHARSAPELAADPMETSPSSSSGFGSKNTSQQNQSSQSGSTSAEWRLPPYRPPPPPPPPPTSLPPLVGHWLALTANLQDTSPPHSEPGRSLSKPLDASVDGHYEFDTDNVFLTTPTSLTPPGIPHQRFGSSIPFIEDRGISDSEIYTTSLYPPRPKRLSKYDNIEARVQAMKEEFHEFRKRQAKRRRSEELESAC